jgi:K+-transporting ATPase KdpF subunit
MRSTDEVRWGLGLDSALSLVVSVVVLGYLVVALLRPERF